MSAFLTENQGPGCTPGDLVKVYVDIDIDESGMGIYGRLDPDKGPVEAYYVSSGEGPATARSIQLLFPSDSIDRIISVTDYLGEYPIVMEDGKVVELYEDGNGELVPLSVNHPVKGPDDLTLWPCGYDYLWQLTDGRDLTHGEVNLDSIAEEISVGDSEPGACYAGTYDRADR